MSKRVPLDDLFTRLGEPASRGVRVMSDRSELPRYRIAHMLWMCSEATSDSRIDAAANACPISCVAQNTLPYETLAFSAMEFPADAWRLVPCARHASEFESFPDYGNNESAE